jgi:hypothetical protein
MLRGAVVNEHGQALHAPGREARCRALRRGVDYHVLHGTGTKFPGFSVKRITVSGSIVLLV